MCVCRRPLRLPRAGKQGRRRRGRREVGGGGTEWRDEAIDLEADTGLAPVPALGVVAVSRESVISFTRHTLSAGRRRTG